MRLLLFIFCLVPFTDACAKDPLLTGPGLEIDLISETQSITAGKPLTVGLHIHHLPGFHTYWKSPGNVGIPTAIKWTLPEGFSASEIRWPSPENSFMGEYPCHGYERDVTLLITITPPKTLTEENITLKAESQWMCCAKGCFPGFKTFNLSLPVTAEPIPNTAAQILLRKAQRELPKKDHEIQVKQLTKADAKIIKLQFRGPRALPTKNLYFFSSDGQISSDQKQVFQPQKDGSLILEIPRSDYSPEGKTTIPGVLRLDQQFLEIVTTSAPK